MTEADTLQRFKLGIRICTYGMALLLLMAGMFRSLDWYQWRYELDNREGLIVRKSSATGWVADLLGDEHYDFLFAPVVLISALGEDFDDEWVARLCRCRSLRRVKLIDTSVSSAGIGLLADSPQLTAVTLRGRNVTDAHLAALSGLSGLVWLEASGANISDEGVRHVARLPALQKMRLTGTGITDYGASIIAGMPTLTGVSLSMTGITDKGVAHLAQLPELTHLFLSGTAITDAALVHAATCHKLQDLFVDHTAVTDAGIRHLADLPGLEYVAAYHTQVTGDVELFPPAESHRRILDTWGDNILVPQRVQSWEWD